MAYWSYGGDDDDLPDWLKGLKNEGVEIKHYNLPTPDTIKAEMGKDIFCPGYERATVEKRSDRFRVSLLGALEVIGETKFGERESEIHGRPECEAEVSEVKFSHDGKWKKLNPGPHTIMEEYAPQRGVSFQSCDNTGYLWVGDDIPDEGLKCDT